MDDDIGLLVTEAARTHSKWLTFTRLKSRNHDDIIFLRHPLQTHKRNSSRLPATVYECFVLHRMKHFIYFIPGNTNATVTLSFIHFTTQQINGL